MEGWQGEFNMIFVKTSDELQNAIKREEEEIIVVGSILSEIKSVAEFRFLTEEELEKLMKHENLIMIALGITPVAVLGVAFGNSRDKVMAFIKGILPNYVNSFMDVFDVIGLSTFDLIKKYEIIELQLENDGYIRFQARI